MLLKLGSNGTDVKFLQYGLHIMCCSPNGFDGNFGPGTETAVRKFQGTQGLSIDGQVGDTTWRALVAEIKIIQRAIVQKNYYSCYIDGVADAGLYGAILNFQRINGLSADGQVGNATRAKLMGSASIGTSGFPLKQGSTGDNVLYLQYSLHILCCNPGGIDGSFGSSTEAAVKKFQNKYGMSADGVVGTGTWSKLQALIKEIQGALVKAGYDTHGIDGLAGPATYEAIIAFQRAKGLSVDGQVGPATREHLLGNVADGGSDSFPLKQGSKGPYVVFLQNALWIMCINPNGRDGSFGSGTEAAVRKFQNNYGLSADGIVGTATWEKIRNIIRPIQQALVNHGYNTGGVDGIAGENTYTAIITFQQAKGLSADGMVGNATKMALGINGSSGGSGTTSATLMVGSNGSLTRYLQRMLQVLGYTVSVDGSFGESTKSAVTAFQNKYGLSADGIVGAGTWNKLFQVYKVPVSGSGVQKMVNVAEHELAWGFSEDNSNNITPYGEWYGIQNGAWCAMFVSWCAYQAGILGTKVPRYAYCPYGVNDYRAKGKYYSRSGGYTPKIGDTIFFWNTSEGVVGHTGIVVGVTATEVETIEGNASDAVRRKRYSRTNTYIHGYGCNDGSITPPIKPPSKPTAPTDKESFSALPSNYKQACKNQLVTIMNTLKIPDISASFPFPGKKEYPICDWFKITLETEVGTTKSFVDDCNIELDLTGNDIIYHSQSIKDSLKTIASICNPDDFLFIAFTTNQGRLGCKFNVENGWINFRFAFEYAHEADETLSWTMQFAVTYSFKQQLLPSAISVTAEYIADLTENINIVVSKKDVLMVSILVVVLLLIGPEVGMLVTTGGETIALAGIVATIFGAVKNLF